MSILTQVRQRCLSAASWRFDIRDSYGYFPQYQYRTTNNNITTTITSTNSFTTTAGLTKRNQKVSDSCYKLIPGKCQNMFNNRAETCESKAFNTPMIHHLRNPILDEKFNRGTIRSAGLSPSHQSESQRYNLQTQTSSILNDTLAKGVSLNKKALLYHIFENVRLILGDEKDSYGLSKRLKHQSGDLPRYTDSGHRGGRKSRDDGYKQDSNHAFKKLDTPSLIPIVAFLGLFKGATESDIEDEKEQLTDEQKMKKMKPVELVIARGVLAMTDQEHTKASQFFHDALRLAQSEKDEERETLVLNLLATNYYESGDFESAEKLYIDIIKRLIALEVEPTDPAILELSLKLASIYSRSPSTQEKALKGFKFVTESLLNRLHDTLSNVEEVDLQDLSEDKRGELALLGWSYDWFAKHLIAINDFNAAVAMMKRALQISLKVLGPLHEQTLILLNDVGTTLAMNNEPDEGKTFIKRAVEGAIECKSKELPSFYVNLGLINLKLKKLADAKRYCEYSIELALKNREHHNSSEVIMLSQKCLNEVEQLLEVDS